MSDDHREDIQAVAEMTLRRISRDLDHIESTLDCATLKSTETVDVLNTLAGVAKTLHDLMHRLDDDMMEWVQEEHVAAVLIDDGE